MESNSLLVKVRKVTILFLVVLSVLLFIDRHDKTTSNDNGIEKKGQETTNQKYLKSYFTNVSDYEKSFAKSDMVEKKKVYAAITSHHYLARDLVAQTFSGIDFTNTENVVMVGPDHFNQIRESNILAQTTDSVWDTPFGKLEPGTNIIKSLWEEEHMKNDVNLFRQEHSIYILMPFTKFTAKSVKVIPLVLRQDPNLQYYFDLGKKLSNTVDMDKIVVMVSSDFSHYVTKKVAKENDKKSVELLPLKNLGDVGDITNDCRQCTAFLFGYLSSVKTDFQLVENKDSYDISGERKDYVTSYVSAYFLPTK